MCFATVEVTVTNLKVMTMHHNKDTQEEIVIIEAVVWAFWILLISVSYLFAKVIL